PGDARDVLVAVDDTVAKDRGLVTLESGACTGPASAGPASVETRDATAWGGPPSWAARDMRMAARLVVPSTGSHPHPSAPGGREGRTAESFAAAAWRAAGRSPMACPGVPAGGWAVIRGRRGGLEVGRAGRAYLGISRG